MADPQHSEIEKCPTCGTTRITFDPPLVFEASEACGVLRPGTYGTNAKWMPTCDLMAGHDGQHVALIEFTEEWSDG